MELSTQPTIDISTESAVDIPTPLTIEVDISALSTIEADISTQSATGISSPNPHESLLAFRDPAEQERLLALWRTVEASEEGAGTDLDAELEHQPTAREWNTYASPLCKLPSEIIQSIAMHINSRRNIGRFRLACSLLNAHYKAAKRPQVLRGWREYVIEAQFLLYAQPPFYKDKEWTKENEKYFQKWSGYPSRSCDPESSLLYPPICVCMNEYATAGLWSVVKDDFHRMAKWYPDIPEWETKHMFRLPRNGEKSSVVLIQMMEFFRRNVMQFAKTMKEDMNKLSTPHIKDPLSVEDIYLSFLIHWKTRRRIYQGTKQSYKNALNQILQPLHPEAKKSYSRFLKTLIKIMADGYGFQIEERPLEEEKFKRVVHNFVLFTILKYPVAELFQRIKDIIRDAETNVEPLPDLDSPQQVTTAPAAQLSISEEEVAKKARLFKAARYLLRDGFETNQDHVFFQPAGEGEHDGGVANKFFPKDEDNLYWQIWHGYMSILISWAMDDDDGLMQKRWGDAFRVVSDLQEVLGGEDWMDWKMAEAGDHQLVGGEQDRSGDGGQVGQDEGAQVQQVAAGNVQQIENVELGE